MSLNREKCYDVAILGSGIGGTMLAAVLTRNGASVVIIDAGTHPHFAIGESMIPETGSLLRVIAERFSVPEIGRLSRFHLVRDHISPACGVKRAFSFVYHREGKEPLVEEMNQFATLTPPFGPDSHLFRQDVDTYMLATAARYGATVHQRCLITEFELEDDKWQLKSDDGFVANAKFVVDAAGFRSPLGKKLGLRDETCRMQTDSRSLFTHMVGVQHYEESVCRKQHGLPYAFSQTTLHHVFDGGWMWVIPFNNHRESTNALCSVGLVLDRRQHPETGQSGQEEFNEFLERYPSIAGQFKNAQSVRPWISTGRIQYSSSGVTGERCCLLPHSAGFIDPFFSSGLGITASTVNVLGSRLLKCIETDDFSQSHFQPMEESMQRHLDHYDLYVSRCYDSFAHYPLWNSWFRVIALGNYLGTLGPLCRHVRYEMTKKMQWLDELEKPPYRGFGACELPEFHELVQAAAAEIDQVREGQKDPDVAATNILTLLGNAEFCPPQFRIDSPEHRYLSPFTMLPMMRLYFWIRGSAPRRMKELYYDDVGFLAIWRMLFGVTWEETRRAIGILPVATRDMVKSWNSEWKRPRP